MGLVVITEFEEYLSATLRHNTSKKLLERDDFKEFLLVISRTSSRNAKEDVKGNEIEEKFTKKVEVI